MQTDLVANARIPSSDATLMQALQRLQAPLDNLQSMTIGVEGDDGTIYRVVRTNGLCETVRVFESARQLGFDIATASSPANDQFQKVLRRRA
jgi:hypothetical protein